jgi:predicted PurR-regulated permease PerM
MPDGDGARESAQQRSARQAILFAFAVAASVAVAVLTVRMLLVIFAGLLFALVLHAVAAFLERRVHVPYKAAVAACVVLLLAAAVLGFSFSVPVLAAQLKDLGAKLPQSIDNVRQTLHLPPLATPGGKPLDWGANIEKFSSHALTALGTSVEVFGGLVVFFFVGVYGALEPDSYARILLWCVPSSKKRRVRRILSVSTGNLERWLLGRLVAMLFVGIASGIAFMVLHVPLALPLAVLAGLLTFVEYVGAFASAVPPILLAFSQSPTHALWVALVFAALHIIEGYVLTPLLARTAVRFPPASTLASQAVFSALLGPMGLTFATPLMIVGVTALQEWRKNE